MYYKNIIELMINNLEEGIIVVDSNLNIRYFNEPSIDITGINPEEAIGKIFFKYFPILAKKIVPFVKYLILKTL